MASKSTSEKTLQSLDEVLNVMIYNNSLEVEEFKSLRATSKGINRQTKKAIQKIVQKKNPPANIIINYIIGMSDELNTYITKKEEKNKKTVVTSFPFKKIYGGEVIYTDKEIGNSRRERILQRGDKTQEWTTTKGLYLSQLHEINQVKKFFGLPQHKKDKEKIQRKIISSQKINYIMKINKLGNYFS